MVAVTHANKQIIDRYYIFLLILTVYKISQKKRKVLHRWANLVRRTCQQKPEISASLLICSGLAVWYPTDESPVSSLLPLMGEEFSHSPPTSTWGRGGGGSCKGRGVRIDHRTPCVIYMTRMAQMMNNLGLMQVAIL